MENNQTYGLIEGPSRYLDTLATWEQHLNYLKSLPDDMINKQELIESAESTIKVLKENPPPGPMLTPSKANGVWPSVSERLTPSEIQSLRQEAKETSTFAQKAFAHVRPKD